MSTGRKLLLVSAALAGGIALARGAGAQVSGPSPSRFDPFNPQLWLNAPDAPPTTQPTVSSPTPTDPTTPTTPTLSPRPRPIIRDPLRPPTRSPFRP